MGALYTHQLTLRTSLHRPIRLPVSRLADLQTEPRAALSVTGPRTYVGSPAELSAAAGAVAEQLASRSPVTTVPPRGLEPC